MVSIKPNILYVRDQGTGNFVPLLAIKGEQGNPGPPGASDLEEVSSELETMTNALKFLYGDGTLGLKYRLDGDTYTVTRSGDAINNLEIIIPPSIANIPVTKIDSDAFQYCYNLTSVTIPESIESIGHAAFASCYKLVEVINKSTLNDMTAGSVSYGRVAYYALEVHSGNSKVVTQGDYQFYTYEGVNYLVNYIGTDTDLILPANYNGENYVINKYAFRTMDNITSITIPDSVISIGENAFETCTSLTEVRIGNGITSISDNAFLECFALSNIYIAKSEGSIEGEKWGAPNTTEVHWNTED